MKSRLIGALLLLTLQNPFLDPELEHDRKRTLSGSPTSAVVIRALYEDGTPMSKGKIWCSGWWYKYADRKEDLLEGYDIWWRADSRGAIVLNPWVGDTSMECRATKDGKYGSTALDLGVPGARFDIVIR